MPKQSIRIWRRSFLFELDCEIKEFVGMDEELSKFLLLFNLNKTGGNWWEYFFNRFLITVRNFPTSKSTSWLANWIADVFSFFVWWLISVLWVFIYLEKLYSSYIIFNSHKMFPFHVPNTYLNTQFPYNLNYDFFGLQQLPGNPLFYPYNYQNINLPHENNNANFIAHQHAPCFLPTDQNSSPKNMLTITKRKRITKKLTLTGEGKTVRSLTSYYKAKRNTFKYLDPSRAPPITSLRTNR